MKELEALYGEPGGGIVYVIGSESNPEKLWSLAQPSALVAVRVKDWNRELSPWPAEKCFKGGSAFDGGADELLAKLTEELIPRAEAGRSFRWRAIAGYSLAGLFALYALSRASCFNAALSASGSLWFDGWMDYLRGHALSGKAVYLSLGGCEEHTKNARLAAVGENTRETERILRARGLNTVLEMNEGGHFADADERIAKGVRWLLRQPMAK